MREEGRARQRGRERELIGAALCCRRAPHCWTLTADLQASQPSPHQSLTFAGRCALAEQPASSSVIMADNPFADNTFGGVSGAHL